MNVHTGLQMSFGLKLISNNTTHMVGKPTCCTVHIYIYMCALKISQYAIQDPGACSSCINQFRYPGLGIIAIVCICTYTISCGKAHSHCMYVLLIQCHAVTRYGCKSYAPLTIFDRQKTWKPIISTQISHLTPSPQSLDLFFHQRSFPVATCWTRAFSTATRASYEMPQGHDKQVASCPFRRPTSH